MICLMIPCMVLILKKKKILVEILNTFGVILVSFSFLLLLVYFFFFRY